MAHEKSVTKITKKPKGGNRYVLVDNSGIDKGRKLNKGHGTITPEAMDKTAKKRSKSFNASPNIGGPRVRKDSAAPLKEQKRTRKLPVPKKKKKK